MSTSEMRGSMTTFPFAPHLRDTCGFSEGSSDDTHGSDPKPRNCEKWGPEDSDWSEISDNEEMLNELPVPRPKPKPKMRTVRQLARNYQEMLNWMDNVRMEPVAPRTTSHPVEAEAQGDRELQNHTIPSSDNAGAAGTVESDGNGASGEPDEAGKSSGSGAANGAGAAPASTPSTVAAGGDEMPTSPPTASAPTLPDASEPSVAMQPPSGIVPVLAAPVRKQLTAFQCPSTSRAKSSFFVLDPGVMQSFTDDARRCNSRTRIVSISIEDEASI